MRPPAFNNDFYVVTATVIPLLWLTAGLATSTLEGLLRIRTAVREVVRAMREVTPHLAKLIPSRRLPPSLHVAAFVGSGFIGEGLSLIALANRLATAWVQSAVLICTLVLLAYCVALITMAIVVGQGSRLSKLEASLGGIRHIAGATARARDAVSALDDVAGPVLHSLKATAPEGDPQFEQTLNDFREAAERMAAYPREDNSVPGAWGNWQRATDAFIFTYSAIETESLSDGDRSKIEAALRCAHRVREHLEALKRSADALGNSAMWG